MRQGLNALLPSACMLGMTVLCVLPWGTPAELRYLLPQMPLLLILYVSRRNGMRLPLWLIFICGLGVDVASAGPMGYWPLVYLAGHILTAVSWPISHEGWIGRWAHASTVIVLLAIIEWLVASLYFLEITPVQPIALASGILIIAFPLVAAGLEAAIGEAEQLAKPIYTRGR